MNDKNTTLQLEQSFAFKPNDLNNHERQAAYVEVSNDWPSSERYAFYDLKEQNNRNSASVLILKSLFFTVLVLEVVLITIYCFNCFTTKVLV